MLFFFSHFFFVEFMLALKYRFFLFYFQVAGKRVPEEELQAQQWIEQITGERFPNAPYEYALRDGVILCKLMNRLAPGVIQKINTTGGDYKLMDNINQLVFNINFHLKLISKCQLHFKLDIIIGILLPSYICRK